MPHLYSVSTSRAASPVVVSQPAVVSSHSPVHMLRVVPRLLDTGQAVRPPSTDTVPATFSSQPPRMSLATSSIASRFRPPVSAVIGFQAGFNRATSATGSSLHQLLSPSASATAGHSTKSCLPFSSSSPNLAAAGTSGKPVLGDSSQVISTMLPFAGSERRLDDGKLRKNSSVASGIASVNDVQLMSLFPYYATSVRCVCMQV